MNNVTIGHVATFAGGVDPFLEGLRAIAVMTLPGGAQVLYGISRPGGAGFEVCQVGPAGDLTRIDHAVPRGGGAGLPRHLGAAQPTSWPGTSPDARLRVTADVFS